MLIYVLNDLGKMDEFIYGKVYSKEINGEIIYGKALHRRTYIPKQRTRITENYIWIFPKQGPWKSEPYSDLWKLVPESHPRQIIESVFDTIYNGKWYFATSENHDTVEEYYLENEHEVLLKILSFLDENKINDTIAFLLAEQIKSLGNPNGEDTFLGNK